MYTDLAPLGRIRSIQIFFKKIEQLKPETLGELAGLKPTQEQIKLLENKKQEIKKMLEQEYFQQISYIRNLIKEYNPTAIKCDIEEYETNFYDITQEEMANVVEFGLEYHSFDILEKMTQKLIEWGFTIHTEAKFGFVNAPQMGVLFCSKNK